MSLCHTDSLASEVRARLVEQYLSEAQGILHLGAHLGQEREIYANLKKPVLWVEAQPNIHSRLQENIKLYPNQKAFCALLGDKDGVQTQFHISNNMDGVSSSIFSFGVYGSGNKSLWPELDLAMVNTLTLPMVRLDTLLSANAINATQYDFCVIDLQGAECLALKGAEEFLKTCRALYVEVSTEEVYTKGVLWPEIHDWMDKAGFMSLWTPAEVHDMILFVRKETRNDVLQIFHSDGYLRHNQRRLEHLASLGLELHGKHVLEAGAGIGDHSYFYLDRGCRVAALEIRPENLKIMQERFHGNNNLTILPVDINSPPQNLGLLFDVVHCYGLLYHLCKPGQALRFLANHCAEMLLLETCVSYGTEIEINRVNEKANNYTQSFYGQGCRPTRTWIWHVLGSLFEYVYMPYTQPCHDEFPLDWTSKNDNPNKLARSIFVASRLPIASQLLANELLSNQRSF